MGKKTREIRDSLAALVARLDAMDGEDGTDWPEYEIRCDSGMADDTLRVANDTNENVEFVLSSSWHGTVYVSAATARRFAAAILRVCDEVEGR